MKFEEDHASYDTLLFVMVLCFEQVRLFLLEESPAQVGLGGQDHLQAKTSLASHSTGSGSDDNLPPGFEGAHPANQLLKLSQIDLIKWRSPPRVSHAFRSLYFELFPCTL